jgi:predicted Fe-Mo cluster-binding NifX family protein
MKLAIGVENERRLFGGHFGESPAFLVVDLDRPGESGRESRPNPWHAEPIATRPPKIAALLADCETILVRAIAKEGLIQLSGRFAVLLAPTDDLAAILSALDREGHTRGRRFDPELGKFVAGSTAQPPRSNPRS